MRRGNQLSTGQIDVVARHPPNRGTTTYAGTGGADQTLACLKRLARDPSTAWGMVFNVDLSDLPRQHWLALHSPAGTSVVECLDSYGTVDGSRYAAPEVRAIVRRAVPVELPQLQSDSTYVCGHYCLAYL